MSRYRKIHVKMWSSLDFASLSPMKPSAQGLFVYLLTGPHTTAIPGLFVAGPASLAEAQGWPVTAWRRCFEELSRKDMAVTNAKTRLIYLPAALSHNRPSNPNAVKAWTEEWKLLPRCELLTRAQVDMHQTIQQMGESFLAPWRVVVGIDSPNRSPNDSGNSLSRTHTRVCAAPAPDADADPALRSEGVQGAAEPWTLDWLRAEWMGALNEATGTMWPPVPPYPEESVALEGIGALAQQHDCPPDEFRKRLMENILVWKADNRGYVSERPTRYVAWMARERVKSEQAAEAARNDGKVGVLPGLRRGAVS